MNSHKTVHNLHHLFKSASRNGHGMETVLLYVYKIGDTTVGHSKSVRNIGVIFDSQLNIMVDHVGAMCRSFYLHIRNIGQIGPCLSKSATEKMVHAFIFSRMHHHNSLLYGLPKYLTDKLQRIQNNTTCNHIQSMLQSLHWLSVPSRIKYKILLLTYKCINDTAPAYLHQLIKPYQPTHALHSAHQPLLQKGKPNTKTYEDHAL